MIKALAIKEKINLAGKSGIPFLFGIDFEVKNGFFIEYPLEQQFIRFSVNGIGNDKSMLINKLPEKIFFHKYPTAYSYYQKKFNIIHNGLSKGNSFLANLTEKTEIETNLSFEEIYTHSNAPYKLLFPDRFICFSPESFVRIHNGIIESFPMKGTIDAAIENAENRLLNNNKEKCEHYTIVDLIRNDLSQSATEVHVERFRYVEPVLTNTGKILQTSSHITGKLPTNYLNELGDILFNLLPAGSVSGAPKQSTVNLIRQAEKQSRGYYCGIFGYFDGSDLESAVMIRFIEKENGKLFFRSGGGITINSQPEEEYQEVLEKIYLPISV